MHLTKHLVIPETRHQMYLKVAAFNTALLALGCLEDADAARLIGMKTTKTIKSARDLGQPVSDEFMANTLAAFKLNAERLEPFGLVLILDTFFEEGTREQREQARLAKAVA